MFVTADHGNAEQMRNEETGQPHTAHSNGPVPLIYVGRPAHMGDNGGSLSDVVPSMLHAMNLPKPNEMSGRPLMEFITDTPQHSEAALEVHDA
jgi:2,3-bisphosphoglycerate-independent phosphoglycerate mutase